VSSYRKLLIVSPRFPPTNAADIHRVRTSLAHYRSFGWEPTVLAVDPATADCLDDPALAEALPADIPVRRVLAWSEARCRRFGFGQLAYRSLLPLYRAGCDMLRGGRYDVVLFSTTVFLCFAIGRLWKRRYGCAVVFDFHDIWYRGPLPRAAVPGDPVKYRIDQWLAKRLERFALRSASHVFTVSEFYIATLSRRYPWLKSDQFTVLPFGAEARDYAFVRDHEIRQTVFQPDRGARRWVCAGAIAPAMVPVVAALCHGLASWRAAHPAKAAALRLTFVGTDYAPAGRQFKRAEPIARECGVSDLVEEFPGRIPYFEALAFNLAGDAILLIGSVEADYTASKLFTVALSKKPILALFHRGSLVSKIAASLPNVFLATFAEGPAEAGFQARIADGIEWLLAAKFDAAAIEARVEPWSAMEMTRRQCLVFDRIAAGASSPAAG
jgi:glycosyltransferase involved in cell wall biosynthesis